MCVWMGGWDVVIVSKVCCFRSILYTKLIVLS